jgi:hypothetical protein
LQVCNASRAGRNKLNPLRVPTCALTDSLLKQRRGLGRAVGKPEVMSGLYSPRLLSLLPVNHPKSKTIVQGASNFLAGELRGPFRAFTCTHKPCYGLRTPTRCASDFHNSTGRIRRSRNIWLEKTDDFFSPVSLDRCGEILCYSLPAWDGHGRKGEPVAIRDHEDLGPIFPQHDHSVDLALVLFCSCQFPAHILSQSLC